MAGPGFDPTLKDLVEEGPADWPVLARLPVGPTRVIDADIATVTGAGDKVLRVDADPAYLLHLEFLVGHDAAVQPRKLHKRNLLLEDRHDLDVQTVLVLLRPDDDSPLLTGQRHRTFRNASEPYMVFRYHVLRVWEMPASQLLSSGPAMLPLAPLTAVTEGQLPGIIQQMERRLSTRALRRIAPKIWAATYVLMGVRFPRALVEQLLRGVQSMKESTTYQAILSEGRAEGRVEGRVEGRAEGALAGARRLLLRLGETRLGRADASVRASLDDITDIDKLDELGDRLLHVSSWRELLSEQPRRRSRRRRLNGD
jgi:predicted transposase YdaD